jgi:trehalose synthase
LTQLLDTHLENVHVARRSRDGLRDLSTESYERAEQALKRGRVAHAGCAIWHVNASAADGVAEILRSLLGYTRDGGIDARWLIAGADHDFHLLSRRLYNNLYGVPGDGGELGQPERELYEGVTSAQGVELARLVSPGDVVYLHDPPAAGMVSAARGAGATAIWRCHLGVERGSELVQRAWDFLRPYVADADACVFSRREYAWDGIDPAKVAVIRPSIDPFSPKNQHLDPETVAAILDQIGLTATGVDGPCTFTRFDSSPGRIDRTAEIDQEMPVPSEASMVAQVSGWERLKDQHGLVAAFAQLSMAPDSHLVLVGPSTSADPPESEEHQVLADLRQQRLGLPEDLRRRVHLVQLPMDDRDDNATMVNAIQRRADVVVHKPLQEGFGLSVAEAMWKERPIVASRVGGIPEQIVDGESGILIDDPRDQAAFAEAIDRLLLDPDRSHSLGVAAKARVAERFSVIDHLADYLELIEDLQSR